MAKEKPDAKKAGKGKARRVPPNQRHITVTLPDGTAVSRAIGPVPKRRAGGVRKRYSRKKTKWAWNIKPRKRKMGDPKSHYKKLSKEKKETIEPMSFMSLPGELRNQIYPDLLDQIEGRILVFTNNPTGLVAGWPTTVVPRIPVGLLCAGDKKIRKEILPLAYEKADVHIRIVSAHLKSPDELYAWVSGNDAITFSSLDMGLITKLSLTVLLPCSFETIHEGQGIDYTFIARMARLRLLRVRVQVHVPNPHISPWTIFNTPVPNSTFTPFVTRVMEDLFAHIATGVVVEFGDGVDVQDGGLGSWVDERADGKIDQGWMENPRIGVGNPESTVRERDTVAVPVHQAESVWGALRARRGTASAFDGVSTGDEGDMEEEVVVDGDGDGNFDTEISNSDDSESL